MRVQLLLFGKRNGGAARTSSAQNDIPLEATRGVAGNPSNALEPTPTANVSERSDSEDSSGLTFEIEQCRIALESRTCSHRALAAVRPELFIVRGIFAFCRKLCQCWPGSQTENTGPAFGAATTMAASEINDDPCIICLKELALAVHRQYGLSDSIHYANEAISIYRMILALTTEESTPRSFYLSNLGILLMHRGQFSENRSDIDEAIHVTTLAATLSPDDDEFRFAHFHNQGNSLYVRFQLWGDVTDLDEAITAHERAALAPDGEEEKATYLASLAVALHKRYIKSDKRSDIDESISVLNKAVTLCTDELDKALYLQNLGTFFQNRFSMQGDLTDIDHAVSNHRHSVALTAETHANKAERLLSLSSSLGDRFRHSRNLMDINDAIPAAKQALLINGPARESDVIRPEILSQLGLLLQSRFEYQPESNHADLEEALILQREAIMLIPDGHDSKPVFLTNLSKSLHHHYLVLGCSEDISEGIKSITTAVNWAPDGNESKIRRLDLLSTWLRLRFETLGDTKDIDEAISASTSAVELVPDGHPDKSSYYLDELSKALSRRFDSLGDIADIDRAIVIERQAISSAPVDEKPGYMVHLGYFLRDRFKFLRMRANVSVADIDEAVALHRQALYLTELHDLEDKPFCLNGLGVSLQIRFIHTGNIVDINEAIDTITQAVALTPDGHKRKPQQLNNLGKAFRRRFERLKYLTDIGEAISLHTQAITLTVEGDDSMHLRLNELGESFQSRFKHLTDLKDIDEAISVQTRAIALTPVENKTKAMYLNSLGQSLQMRFKSSNNLDELDRAISVHRQALLIIPDESAMTILDNLGIVLDMRFERKGELADVDEAIQAYKKAIERVAGKGDRREPTYLSHLGDSLGDRFDMFGHLTDVDEAVSCHRQALSLTPIGDEEQTLRLNYLGICLQLRFDRLHILSDIDETIQIYSDLTSRDSHDPIVLGNLGNALASRFWAVQNVMDIDDAIRAMKQAVALVPDDGRKADYLNNLGAVLQERFATIGDSSDLDEAISVKREAVRLSIDGYADKPGRMDSLGISLQSRFDRIGAFDDIEEALCVEREAVKLTPDEHADMSRRLHSLGMAFEKRYSRLNDPIDIDRAIDLHRKSALSLFGDPSWAFRGATAWARCTRLKDGQSSFEAYEAILGLIPRIVWLGTEITSRFQGVLSLGTVVNEAVAAACRRGRLDLAVEWLEQGRSIVWGQLLRLRTPLDELRTLRADVANELQQISAFLGRKGKSDSSTVTLHPKSERSKRTMEESTQIYRRKAEQYERLLKEVRQIPGFEHFLLPKRLSSLSVAASQGCVVIINVHEAQCDAIILRDPTSAPAHIPLPEMSHKLASYLHSLLRRFTLHPSLRRRDDRAIKKTTKSDPKMQYILENLWSRIVEPVLNALGYLEVQQQGVLPHVTWCATGPLAFMPLHAAGMYNKRESPKVFNHVVSSYTPNLTILEEAHRREASTFRGILAISQPHTPNHGRLPGTITEIQRIKLCIGEDKLKWLNAESATIEAVLSAMKEYSWLHLACHGVQDIVKPTQSAFALHDGNLDLETIISNDLKSTEVAFLSACQTATGDQQRPEEAVHLAAGMLVTGYRTVFATMWSIVDADAPLISENVYAHLLEDIIVGDGEGRTVLGAAHALHRSVETLRQHVGEADFVRWVPFVHFGV